jgi:hypothetical protein
VIFATLISFGLSPDQVSDTQLVTCTLAVIGNGAMVTIGVRLIQAQDHGDPSWFELVGPFIRYPLLLAAATFTVLSPGRVVAVLWLWWAASGLMGCKARQVALD